MGDVTLEIKLKNVIDKTDKIDVKNAEINYVLTYDVETDSFIPKPPQGGGEITIDDELSDISENPVQNKIITGALKVINDFISKFNFDSLETKDKWVLQYNADTDSIDLSESAESAYSASNLIPINLPTRKYRLVRNGNNHFNKVLSKFTMLSDTSSNPDDVFVGYSDRSYMSEKSKSANELTPYASALLHYGDEDVITLPYGAGLYLLCCYEWTANTGAYRGTHIYTLCATDATTTLQQTTVCASSASGVTITRPTYTDNYPTVSIKPSGSAYAVFYKLFKII